MTKMTSKCHQNDAQVEHQLDKVAALEELCRLHELPLAQALGATIRQQLGQRQ